MIKKIKKVYCKWCKHYISFTPELAGYRKTEEIIDDGKNICSANFNIQKDYTGKKVIQRYGERQYCEYCDTILADKGSLRYEKCINKNRNLDCKQFKFLNIFDLIFILIKNIVGILSIINGKIQSRRLYLFIIWSIIHIITLTFLPMNLFLKIYTGFSVFFFIFYIFEKKL